MRPIRLRYRHVAVLLAVAVGAALQPLSVHAEEGETDAAAAFAKAAKTLPAASPDGGFDFTGVLRINGKNLGFARLSAAPDAGEHAARWVARDRFVFKGRAAPSVQESSAHFGAGLALVSGDSSGSTQPSMTWTRTGEGFAIRWKDEAGEAKEKLVPHQGMALNTMAATVLFTHHVLATPGTYATAVFEPEDGVKGEKAMQPVVVKILGEQELQGRKVLAAQAAKEDKTLTMLFKPDTKALVALRLEQGDSKVEILPGDMWVMPAPDAVTAGMRAMLGFASKQLRILDDVIDWPTTHKAALTRMTPEQRKERGDVEAWRNALLSAWSKQLQERPLPMMQQFIGSQKAQIKQEELEGGRVKLTFPPMLRGSTFIVGKSHGGFWHIVDLPPPPKPADAKGGK